LYPALSKIYAISNDESTKFDRIDGSLSDYPGRTCRSEPYRESSCSNPVTYIKADPIRNLMAEQQLAKSQILCSPISFNVDGG